MKKVRITWIKSGIAAKATHKSTIKSLGLRRLHHSVERELTPVVAGQIASVRYLLNVEELN